MSTGSTVSNEGVIAAALTSFFRGKGFTPAQAQQADAGVLGNLQTESGFNPAAVAVNDGGPGVDAHGIAQWEGGRYSALQAYATQTGGDASSVRTQIGFLEHELSGSKASTVTALKTAPTASAAALAFATGYEGNNPASDSQRESNATSILAQIRAGTLGTATPGSAVDYTDTSDTAGGTAAVEPAFDWNPLNWPGDLAKAGVSGATSALMQVAGGWILKGVLVAGGLGIIGLGLFRASAPARQDVKQAVSDAAPLAAAAV